MMPFRLCCSNFLTLRGVVVFTALGLGVALTISTHAGAVDPAVSVSQTNSFSDTNSDGLVDPGEQVVNYSTVIENAGPFPAENVNFENPIPSGTSPTALLKSTPLARDDAYASIGNVGLDVPATSGLITNDTDFGATLPTVVSPVPGTPTATTSGGTVTIDLGGSGGFTYSPPPGFNGQDSFSYTIADETGAALPAPATGSNIGTVTIEVSDLIWFVDNRVAGPGSGTQSDPLKSLASLQDPTGAGDDDEPGDVIFLYEGTGAAYTGGLFLEANQQLIGESAGLILSGQVIVPAGGGKPRIANSGAVGVTLSSGNTVRGLAIETTSADGIAGGSVGSLSISEVSVTSTGGGVDLAGGALTVSFDAISSDGSDNGIRLVNTTGSFTITGDGGINQNNAGGVIQNTSADGVFLQNAQNITLNQVTIDNTGNNGISGQLVHNLTLNACVLEDNGNSADEAALAFNTETGGADQNITGLLRLDNTDISRFLDIGLHIYQDTGVATVEVVNASDFTDGVDTTAGADSGFGIYIETEGSAGAALTVDGSDFDAIESDIVRFEGGGSAAQDVNVLNCNSTNGGGPDNFPNGGGITLLVTDDRSLTFDIQGNDLRDLPGDGIVISGTTGSGGMEGRIGGPMVSQGNTILQDAAVGVSDGINLVDGVSPAITAGRKAWTILIQNNFLGVDSTGTVNDGLGDDGIQVRLGDNDVDYNLTIENNTIANTGSEGIRIFLDDDVNGNPMLNTRVVNNSFSSIGDGSVELATRDTARACAHITGNDNGSGGSPGTILLDLRDSADDEISQASTAALATANNGATVTVQTLLPLFNGGCTTPTLPMNP